MNCRRKIIFTAVLPVNLRSKSIQYRKNRILSQIAPLNALSSFGCSGFNSLGKCPDPKRNRSLLLQENSCTCIKIFSLLVISFSFLEERNHGRGVRERTENSSSEK